MRIDFNALTGVNDFTDRYKKRERAKKITSFRPPVPKVRESFRVFPGLSESQLLGLWLAIKGNAERERLFFCAMVDSNLAHGRGKATEWALEDCLSFGFHPNPEDYGYFKRCIRGDEYRELEGTLNLS